MNKIKTYSLLICIEVYKRLIGILKYFLLKKEEEMDNKNEIIPIKGEPKNEIEKLEISFSTGITDQDIIRDVYCPLDLLVKYYIRDAIMQFIIDGIIPWQPSNYIKNFVKFHWMFMPYRWEVYKKPSFSRRASLFLNRNEVKPAVTGNDRRAKIQSIFDCMMSQCSVMFKPLYCFEPLNHDEIVIIRNPEEEKKNEI